MTRLYLIVILQCIGNVKLKYKCIIINVNVNFYYNIFYFSMAENVIFLNMYNNIHNSIN